MFYFWMSRSEKQMQNLKKIKRKSLNWQVLLWLRTNLTFCEQLRSFTTLCTTTQISQSCFSFFWILIIVSTIFFLSLIPNKPSLLIIPSSNPNLCLSQMLLNLLPNNQTQLFLSPFYFPFSVNQNYKTVFLLLMCF